MQNLQTSGITTIRDLFTVLDGRYDVAPYMISIATNSGASASTWYIQCPQRGT